MAISFGIPEQNLILLFNATDLPTWKQLNDLSALGVVHLASFLFVLDHHVRMTELAVGPRAYLA